MSTLPEPMDIAVRAWAIPDRTREGDARRRRRHRPSVFVVLDCETELHGAQSLLVACYRYVRVTWNKNVPTLTTALLPLRMSGRTVYAYGCACV